MSRKGQAVSAVAQLPSGARVLITHEMQPFPLSYCPYCPLIIIALYQTITVFRVHCSESNSASVSSLAGLPTPTPVLIRASTDFTFFSICFPKLFPPLFSLSASTSTHDTQRHTPLEVLVLHGFGGRKAVGPPATTPPLRVV